jgi:hypothetical protein
MLRRLSFASAIALAGLLVMSCAPYGSNYYGFSLDISNAPPPRFAFERQPDLFLIAGTDIYEVDADLGYDGFRCDNRWYVNDNGYWYVAADYRGPFTIVSARAVPRRVLTLPDNRWRHHPHGGPPGQMRRGDNGRRDDRRGDGDYR